MVTKEGNVLEIEFIEPVRPLAPAFLVATENRYPVDVITTERTVFYVIPRTLWLREMMANETLLTNFMKVTSNMTVFLSKKVQMMSIKSLNGEGCRSTSWRTPRRSRTRSSCGARRHSWPSTSAYSAPRWPAPSAR